MCLVEVGRHVCFGLGRWIQMGCRWVLFHPVRCFIPQNSLPSEGLSGCRKAVFKVGRRG